MQSPATAESQICTMDLACWTQISEDHCLEIAQPQHYINEGFIADQEKRKGF